MAKIGKRGANPSGTLSTQEAAVVLGISHPTLLKLLKQQTLPEPQQLSGTRYWNAADLSHARLVIADLHAKGLLRLRSGRR